MYINMYIYIYELYMCIYYIPICLQTYGGFHKWGYPQIINLKKSFP